MRDIPFSDNDFRAIADLALAEFGLSLAESKKPLVYSRLSRRLKARDIAGFPEYIALLGIADETEERLELISALTTNVTSFFREKHHFETLSDAVLSPMIAEARSGRRVRLWSAGCSSGQEAYSMAMTVLEALPEASRLNIKILATDIDPKILARAKAGRYPIEERQGIPAASQKAWTETLADDSSHFAIAQTARSLVSFAEMNLMAQWPCRGPFDAIFCRNVAIYFNQETQQRLWTRFAALLREGGYLFIGHSERVTGPALDTLRGVGITSYQHIGGASLAKLH